MVLLQALPGRAAPARWATDAYFSTGVAEPGRHVAPPGKDDAVYLSNAAGDAVELVLLRLPPAHSPGWCGSECFVPCHTASLPVAWQEPGGWMGGLKCATQWTKKLGKNDAGSSYILNEGPSRQLVSAEIFHRMPRTMAELRFRTTDALLPFDRRFVQSVGYPLNYGELLGKVGAAAGKPTDYQNLVPVYGGDGVLAMHRGIPQARCGPRRVWCALSRAHLPFPFAVVP